jgi:intracellular sulfur oxidation DsrE/DsrF family protein
MKSLTKVISIAAFLASGVASAQAEEGQCLMVHVPQEDAKAFKQAINIANNVPKQLGADAIRIEVIAQGPGLKLFTKGSPETDRIKSLAAMGDQTIGGGIKFSACAATMAGIKKKTGKEPMLIEGVGVTHPGAVARILELQKEGCTYIRI